MRHHTAGRKSHTMGATLYNPTQPESTIHTVALATNVIPPNKADVVIIGAGIIGLTTAYRLIQSGREVTLLDPYPASEATRAAAGMLAPASEVQYRQEELVPLMKRAGELYPEFAEKVQANAGITVGLRNTPTMVCAFDAADKQALEDLSAYQRELGLDVNPISPRTARQHEPVLSPRLSGVIDIQGDHQINPRWFTTALLELLAPHIYTVTATEILTHTTDETTRATGVRWNIDTSGEWGPAPIQEGDPTGGTITANDIVIANGLGATTLKGIDALPKLPLRPVHGDVIRLKIPENQQPFLNSTIRGVVRGHPIYLVPREDNTLVIGASSREDTMEGINAGGIYQLLRDARELIPAIEELEIYELISRARPGTPDDFPIIGHLTHQGHTIPNLTITDGFFRHGILLSVRGSEILTHLLTNKLTDEDHRDLKNCSPQRFNH